MTNLFLVFIFLAIGTLLGVLSRRQASKPILLGWQAGVPSNLSDVITTFVIYVSLPSLILLKLPSLEISEDLVVLVAMPWVMIVVSIGLILAAAWAFRWERSVKGTLLLLVPLGNTSFLGIPMVEAFFGADLVPYALLYDQAGSFLALATYGSVVAALFGRGASPDPQISLPVRIFLKIISFPPFLALLLALMVNPASAHPLAETALRMLSDTLVPLVMIAVGFKIKYGIASSHRLPLFIGLGLKLILIPLIALAGCRLLLPDSDAARVAVFESGMPPMVAAWAVAVKAGIEPELGAALVGLGILLALLTLPGLFFLL